MQENQPDPWKKVLLLFVIFILLIGCTNSPRLKNDDFITAWTIAVSVVGLCIGIIFSLVLRSLARSIEAQSPLSSAESSGCSDAEMAVSKAKPPAYSTCCKHSSKETPDGLPTYQEAVAVMKTNELAGIHTFSQKF